MSKKNRRTTTASRTPRRSRKQKSTKKQTCISLLARPRGASLAELEKATGWKPHTVRGFLSGTVKKTIAGRLSSELDEGVRRYRLIAPRTKAS